jgi:ketosteroid isomerase-like protein
MRETSEDDEMTAISDLLDAWTTAERAADTATIDRLLADDFVGVGPLGFLLTKDEWLKRHAPGELTYETFGLEETQTRLYGDAAVTIARQVGKGAYRGNPVPGQVRTTLFLVRNDAQWQIASAHMSFIAGTPGAPPIPGPR